MVAIIIRVLIVAWVAVEVISWKLWLPAHSFPVVPFLALPTFVHIALFVSFFILSILLFIKPTNRYLLLGLLVTEMISMLGDELRWQPWLYQFLFIVFSIVINSKKPRLVINSIIFILASTYFFSGLQKINKDFLQNVWLRQILVHFLHFSNAVYSSRLVRYSGLIVPAVEITAGVLLLLPRQHKLFLLFPIGMHLFVLLFLGPLGIQYNPIVLPWNAAMAIFIYLMFIRGNAVFSYRDLFTGWNKVIAFFWLVMPVVGMLGYWDKFFSSSVYSGISHNMKIYLADTTALPSQLAPFVVYEKKGYQDIHQVINVHDWCMTELNVPVPPEARIYHSIELSFKEKYSNLKPVFVR